MNYITRLKAEREAAEREVQALRLGLNHLKGYLNSGKFNCGSDLDRYVNTADVITRIESLCSHAHEMRDREYATIIEDARRPEEPVAKPESSWSHLMVQAIREGRQLQG